MRRLIGRSLGCLFLVALFPAAANADQPIASSTFSGFEDPLFENGAWQALTSLSPQGTRFLKNNGAYPDRFVGPDPNHAGARTTAAIPTDHYSEIVIGHVANGNDNVGPIVRVQTSGPSIDSHYLWWATVPGGHNSLYRIDANGTSYSHPAPIVDASPVTDGDRIRLVARGLVIYGIKNGVRDFIYNIGPDATKYSGGTTGILAYEFGDTLTDATIASWSSGAANASTGTWDSSNFAGVENPLDEGDRWYPLPTYSGFRKAGGLVIGRDGGHNVSGAWSIAPPQKQYSEVTLGTAASGGGGPMVRIDRNSNTPSGWLLFLFADNPVFSGIYKLNPDGSFTAVQLFTPAIVPGDKWRLTADGNTLTASKNGVDQLTYTTDGSYPAGDVGIEAYTPAFTFMAWEGGDPGPGITGFAPASGVVGTSVTISGTNFAGATAVTFNGTPASFTVTSPKEIQATVPDGSSTGPLGVTTAGGSTASIDSFTVVYPPQISGFTPASGPVGTSVTINGSYFTGATAVTCNGTSASFTVTSDGQIQTTVPAGATTGPLGVTTPSGTATSTGNFTVVDPPAITSFAPASGTVGTNVAINGANFTDASAVTFNGTGASFTVVSSILIQATVPAGATTGPIGVTTIAGTATSTTNFTVLYPPQITSFSPASGPVGTSVTINGVYFTGTTTVTFNGTSASFTVVSDNKIETSVPSGARSGPLGVTTPSGTATSTSNFTVIDPPVINSFAPTSGTVGTNVAINGANFTNASAVTFNGTGASYTVVSSVLIQAAVPSGSTTGPIRVTTIAGTATSATNFTVLYPPQISSFAPASGPVGTGVTINGSYFIGTTAVMFNGTSAGFNVISDNQIQTWAPAGAKTGPLKVITPSGTATSTSNFTVIDPPVITSFAPPAGPVGTSVVINGDNFTGASSVTFNSVSASFSVASDGVINTTVPAGATTGPIAVTTIAGKATSGTNFSVTAVLNVSKTGNGSGTVTSTSSPNNPSQINCGSLCSVTYNKSTVVTLTATPATGSTITKWTGCDTASGATCTVTMSAAKSITATFTLKKYSLKVTKSSLLTGNGTVTSTSSPSNPTQINCGGTCSVSYNHGTVVTLNQTPDFLSVFNGWSGCDSVSGGTCTVTMTGPNSVNADYLP